MGAQLDMFPKPAAPWALPVTVEPARPVLTSCPRCDKAKTDAWGWIVTLGGPWRGVRCDDCWEAEA